MKRFILKYKLLSGLIGLVLLIFIPLGGVYFASFLMGPPPLKAEQNTIYYSAADAVIGEEKGAESRYWVGLDEISPYLKKATLAIEDQHFYEHNGFDYSRIAAAVLKNVKSGSLSEGASTLTQQYARNLYLSFEKTWTRKLKEAFYTVRLEMYYSKDELLEGYLNTIYYGHGAYGAEAASRYFFNKSADELTLAEAAMLAAVPKGPSYYSPFNNLENATKRQHQILYVMKQQGQINDQEYYLATHAKLDYAKPSQHIKKVVAPYFQDTVLLEAANKLDLDQEKIRSGGYKIYTTLNVTMQEKLEKQVADTINPASEIQTGAIGMDPETGAIRALVGGRDYSKSKFNRAIRAKRMPGSTFKPFLYYAALTHGYTPATMLMSKPTAFELSDGHVYQPSNFNGYYAYKPITLAQALALSDNVYAVKTNLFLGVDKLINSARKFGIDSKLPPVPSLALGTATVTVEDMVTGYGIIANGGQQIKAHTIRKIVDRNGDVVYELPKEDAKQILDKKKLFILADLMKGMFDHSLDGYTAVTGSPVSNELTRDYAGKSGTTASDSWMIGFSPNLVTGVWVGYDDNREIDKTAEHGYAKDIWADFMEAAHKELPKVDTDVPEGVVGVWIDPVSGGVATSYCPNGTLMYFEKGNVPSKHCTKHLPEDGDSEKKKEDPPEDDGNKGVFEKIFDYLF
ncbi:monofunctional biosynthetic peptidoglycan transglycosylase [Virgibacillus phasianinus]|uniref:Monofunctional biosynthetic peptidoglycan transglycosylase n=1 Tax=Virgibacillus phasianinus TaxID=2017483 RepID=A0A220U2H2_9BACI|nr:transglycosylase domain-containing protein [Virgibacillus phasianinus]ASK62041.1 monofunctional biosynthetic peptidoglycan transglycosylase [Virgibacillus phasianinus]